MINARQAEWVWESTAYVRRKESGARGKFTARRVCETARPDRQTDRPTDWLTTLVDAQRSRRPAEVGVQCRITQQAASSTGTTTTTDQNNIYLILNENYNSQTGSEDRKWKCINPKKRKLEDSTAKYLIMHAPTNQMSLLIKWNIYWEIWRKPVPTPTHTVVVWIDFGGFGEFVNKNNLQGQARYFDVVGALQMV